MNNFTLNPMPNFAFDSVAMDCNSMTNNMIDNSMVNNLVVDNSTSNDLMDITEMTQGLIIKDSGVEDLMVDDSPINSLTSNHSMAYAHSTNSSANGFPTTNTPVSMGDSIDTPMVDSPISNGPTTNIFLAGNPPAKDSMGSIANPPMTKSLITKGAMVDSSVPTKRAASIFTPVLRESLRNQFLFVDGPRKTEGVWLCAKCIKHLDRDGNDDLRKWRTRYGIWPGLELHPEVRVKKFKCTHCKERRRCNFVKRAGLSSPPLPP
ncbi:Hypothetical protein NCS54_00617400 [Fusarium falciforme]|uniref:Hypothetical protein n=1 Tax=Fusarium falciforme TaxID=195108 RepID=UPI00230107EA|nr:Hypothetical protein NCS54_00617400 [Fusarium falciforme]WAO88812.1 Hypothetical protein NCS54_00617400 [Fusarium falciforme]